MNGLLKIQQQPVNSEKINGYPWPNNQLQQFILANQFPSLQADKNNLAGMQSLYESQMKWASLSNFYNQRMQQMFYAAYIIAQNNLKNSGFLKHQQNFTHSVMPQRNGMNITQRMLFNQPNISEKHNNIYHRLNKNEKPCKCTTKEKENSITDDLLKCNNSENKFRLSKTTPFSHHCKSDIMKNSDLQTTSAKNNKKKYHMQSLTSGFTAKKETDSLTITTSKHLESLQNFTKSTDVISIKLPQIIKASESSSYQNLSPRRVASTNHQIIVTETEAEMIVNQVKEEMRGRDPENMYIKCPLCEKRIKRFSNYYFF